ncbi:MAG: hypothetical protein ACHP7N_15810 [Caulobacterales bacterium]
MILSTQRARVILALTVSVVAISTARAQTPAPAPAPQGPQLPTIGQAQQVVNNAPKGNSWLPSPADIAASLAKLGFGSQTAITYDPNAILQGGTTVSNAAQTDLGAAVVGLGGPKGVPVLINANQQVGDIIDSIEGKPGSQQFTAQQAQVRAQEVQNQLYQKYGPGYSYTDPNTGVSTYHPLPQPGEYAAMDAYVQQYLANQPQVRDPFAQPPTPPTPPPDVTPPPQPPVQIPQIPSGPDYPTYQPKAKTSSQPSDAGAWAGALGEAMGAAMAQAGQTPQTGDAGAVWQETTGAVTEAAAAIAAAGMAGQVTAMINQVVNGGCSSGACGAYLAHPYDPSQWQPMPMFAEGQGSIVDNGANMTATAELLPIYKGYDPFATGTLVPWPGQMMFPSLYQPTGISTATGYTMLNGQWTGTAGVMTSLDLYAALCGR